MAKKLKIEHCNEYSQPIPGIMHCRKLGREVGYYNIDPDCPLENYDREKVCGCTYPAAFGHGFCARCGDKVFRKIKEGR